jgi:hypothetical protein
MDSQIGLGIVLLVFGIALFVFLASRAVLWARRKHGGSEFAGSLGLGSAINPAEALIEERQRVKRSDEGSGDPEELKS